MTNKILSFVRTLKLLLRSAIELFEKILDVFVNRPAHLLRLPREKSFSLQENCYGKAELKKHPGRSGFYLLENNLDAFLARYELIEHSEKTLDLQYYYFHGDTSGRLISRALIEAADRNVRVRILLDDIETLGADESVSTLNAHPGIEIRLFNPFFFRGLLRYIEFITDLSRVGRRMHNKAIIADNCQAIIGGRNIGDNYFSANPEFFFVDIDLLSMGPIVKKISASFDEYWNSRWAVPVENLYPVPDKKTASKKLKRYLQRYVQSVKQVDFEQALKQSSLQINKGLAGLTYIWSDAKLFYDAPTKIDSDNEAEKKYLKTDLREIVSSARHSVTLISPYFVPGTQGLKWLLEMRKNGIEICVYTNSLAATDVVAVHSGYARYRSQLLAAGVSLYELKPSAYVMGRNRLKVLRPGSRSSLHAKTVIIDNERVFIGSPNLDPRSSNLNTEMGLLVNNKVLARQVLDLFSGDMTRKNSYHLMLEGQHKNSAAGVGASASVAKSRIVWSSEEGEGERQYYSDPQAGFWRKLSVIVYRLLPVEAFL
ncbi:Cardiolipin synthetase [hydrothermal vent metagenome]|uniref:Cardiolipin synthetase n=1 Tax=hydrothermal vent metagenome TaxID=652676 RepID=A0A3B0Y2U9_9ZZZZ